MWDHLTVYFTYSSHIQLKKQALIWEVINGSLAKRKSHVWQKGAISTKAELLTEMQICYWRIRSRTLNNILTHDRQD